MTDCISASVTRYDLGECQYTNTLRLRVTDIFDLGPPNNQVALSAITFHQCYAVSVTNVCSSVTQINDFVLTVRLIGNQVNWAGYPRLGQMPLFLGVCGKGEGYKGYLLMFKQTAYEMLTK